MGKLSKILAGILIAGGVTVGIPSCHKVNQLETQTDAAFQAALESDPNEKTGQQLWKAKDQLSAQVSTWDNLFWGSVASCCIGAFVAALPSGRRSANLDSAR